MLLCCQIKSASILCKSEQHRKNRPIFQADAPQCRTRQLGCVGRLSAQPGKSCLPLLLEWERKNLKRLTLLHFSNILYFMILYNLKFIAQLFWLNFDVRMFLCPPSRTSDGVMHISHLWYTLTWPCLSLRMVTLQGTSCEFSSSHDWWLIENINGGPPPPGDLARVRGHL